jgi:hypothetical protein
MDSGTREKARSVLKRILEAASYDVEEVGDPLDLSAIGSNMALVVLCSDDPETIETFDMTTYRLRIGDDDTICQKLLFSLNPSVPVEDAIRWGADEFVRYAGEASLAEVLDRDLILTFSSPVRIVPDEEAVVRQEEEPIQGPDIPHLPVQVSEKRACGIAGVQGSARCRFIPYWYYRYVSSGEREVKDRLICFDAEGTGALNAINNIRTDFDMERIERGPVLFGSEVVQPRVQKDEAEEQLRREVIDQLTQRVRFRYEKGDAIFYEEKILKPERSNIKVDLQMVYVPVWQVRGGSKIVEINAFTGEILSMPMDEGVELL